VEIVSNAKAVLLYAHLDITEPGGVYPLMRHKAGVTFGTFYGVLDIASVDNTWSITAIAVWATE
jgi:hypothetical protein